MPESISCNIGLSRFRTTEGLMPILGQLSPRYTGLNRHGTPNLAATDVGLPMVTRGSQIQVLRSQDLGQQRLVLVWSGEKHRVRGVNQRVQLLTDARRHCTMLSVQAVGIPGRVCSPDSHAEGTATFPRYHS